VALYRRTGRIGGDLPGLAAARIVLVDHVCAKTGVRRTSPLIYHEAAGVVAVVVASKAGRPTHPARFHNLVAQPETTLQLGSEARAVRARVAGELGREHLWPKLSEVYPGYDFFQCLAKRRKIP
jgi:F420H(2)-dependent quinone reductase